jgi:hypothetical protein
MTANPKRSDYWRKMNGAIRSACVARQIDDDSRLALIKSVTGKDSSTECSAQELRSVLYKINGTGPRPPKRLGTTKKRNFADKAVHSKVRALWLTLYHLGAIDSASDEALEAMAKRVCLGGKGNENIVFKLSSMDSKGAFKLIEALKAMCSRAGVRWENYRTLRGVVTNDRARVIEAQWQKLHPRSDWAAMLEEIGQVLGRPSPGSLLLLMDAEADQLIQHFGKLIREGKDNG